MHHNSTTLESTEKAQRIAEDISDLEPLFSEEIKVGGESAQKEIPIPDCLGEEFLVDQNEFEFTREAS